MRVCVKGLALAALLVASWAPAQQSDSLVLSVNGNPFIDPHTMPEYESLGTNIVGVPYYGNVEAAKGDLDTAAAHGLRAVLLGANIDTLGPDLGAIASGRTLRFESESLRDSDQVGNVVADDSATGEQAVMVDSADGPGWFQTAWTDDYIQNANNFKSWGMPYTAFFRLRVTTGGHSPDDTVCRLEVREHLGSADILFAEATLFVRDFTSGPRYDSFAVPFLKHKEDIGRWQYRVYWYARVETLWADNVAFYDMVADSLLRGDMPYVRRAAAIYDEYANHSQHPPYRYYLADEPGENQIRCDSAVNALIEHKGLSQTPGNWQEYVQRVHPAQILCDVYPLMGATNGSQGPHRQNPMLRTPIDCGDTFQLALDGMCNNVANTRLAAMAAGGIPFWVGVQGFGQYLTDSVYAYKPEWNTFVGPSDTPRLDESIWREPTPRELRCMIWLSLSYGAKGIDLYSIDPRWGAWPYLENGSLDTEYYYTLAVEGKHPNNDTWLRRPIYDTVRSFYQNTLKPISKTLYGLASTAAGRSNCFPIGSIRSAVCSTGVADGLLQFGTFTGSGSSYFIVVNRHCLPTDWITDTVGVEQVLTGGTSLFLHDELTGEAIAATGFQPPDIYKFPIHLAPGQGRLFRLIPFSGAIGRNQGQAFANMPELTLTLDYNNGTLGNFTPDSMRIYCYHLPTGVDSIFDEIDSTGWDRYRHDYVYTLHSEGSYRFSVRYKLNLGVVSPVYASPGIQVDWTLPRDSMVLNHNAWFTNANRCTVCSYVSDNSGVLQMQFTNNWMLRPELITDPEITDSTYWARKHCALVESLGVAKLELLPNAQAYIWHLIPADSLGGYNNQQMMLEADVVSDSFMGSARLAVDYLYLWSDPKLGHDTMPMLAVQTQIQNGTRALVGTYNYSTSFTFNPILPPGRQLYGILVGVFADARPDSGGKLWIGGIRLDCVAWDPHPNPTNWLSYDSLYSGWYLTGVHGVNIVKARYRDRAGNEGHWVADAIYLDQTTPQAIISFPGNGKVVTETIIPIEGLAFDPCSAPDTGDFWYYKLTWNQSATSETCFGILPDSLFLSPAPPVPKDSQRGSSGPSRHLADWNVKPLLDSIGPGWYHLRLETRDSANNVAYAYAWVKLDTGSTGLDAMIGGSAAGGTSLTATAQNDLLVGTSTGSLVQYTSGLDSTRALSLTDSSGTPIISGVTTDSTGAILVSDIRARDLKRYTEGGVLEQTIGNRNQLASPDDIAVAANGDVYTIDRSNCVVRIYDVDGNLKRSFGSRGTDTACFDQPAGIGLNHPRSIPGDTTGAYNTPPMVFIADKGNHRVQTFDTTGRFVSIIGAGLLQLPCAVALDSSNDAFVADIGTGAIYAFSPSGRHYLTITGTDTLTPIAAALSNDNGFIYAIDSKHNTLAQYTVLYTDSTVYGGAQSSRTNPLLIPKEVMLGQSYPNPTTGQLTIRYGVPRMMKLSLKVYDITGKVVRTLVNNETMKPGFYNLQWNCTDTRNRHVASGVYFYRLTARSGKQQPNVRTKKLVIAR